MAEWLSPLSLFAVYFDNAKHCVASVVLAIRYGDYGANHLPLQFTFIYAWARPSWRRRRWSLTRSGVAASTCAACLLSPSHGLSASFRPQSDKRVASAVMQTDLHSSDSGTFEMITCIFNRASGTIAPGMLCRPTLPLLSTVCTSVPPLIVAERICMQHAVFAS